MMKTAFTLNFDEKDLVIKIFLDLFSLSFQDPHYTQHQIPNHFSPPVQDQGAGSLSLEQLSQFKSTMEQLLRCNDAQQVSTSPKLATATKKLDCFIFSEK